MFEQITQYLELHQSLAGWAGAFGSMLAVFAGYLFGRGEKSSKQKAFAMHARLLMNDVLNAAADVVNPVLSNEQTDKDLLPKIKELFADLRRRMRDLVQFSVHELPVHAIDIFHEFRVTAADLVIELSEVVRRDGEKIDNRQRTEIDVSYDEMQELWEKFGERFGISSVDSKKVQMAGMKRRQKFFDELEKQKPTESHASNKKSRWWWGNARS